MNLARKGLFIIGGGGHSRVVIDSFLKSGRQIDGIVDPAYEKDELIAGIPVIGGDDILDTFSTDAVQLIGKKNLNLSVLEVNYLSIAPHKYYGPKGIGALYVRRKPRVRIEPQIHGGGHERGMRSGTLPTHQIVGMGEAFRYARKEMHENNKQVYKTISSAYMDDVKSNGSSHHKKNEENE